jgi:hypothetical protein
MVNLRPMAAMRSSPSLTWSRWWLPSEILRQKYGPTLRIVVFLSGGNTESQTGYLKIHQ